ncbi:hypothetical protein D1BOALGB6SA_9543 [Olavius sp. associated proteobacterium Delta 1]|nr:hypothetical protein D1BOALGB6SA_9543 [Olavius sp. associated proteobacterium Delta 1]
MYALGDYNFDKLFIVYFRTHHNIICRLDFQWQIADIL